MKNMVEVKKVICQFCHARCRLLLYSENGHLVKFEEDESYPESGRVFPPVTACLRLRGAKEWMYHPDRVNFPLKRAGERGEGKWQRIPWDQALDEVAQKLKKIKDTYGAEAIAVTEGTGRTISEHISRFRHLLGSPNCIGQSTICHGPVAGVASAMLGWTVRHRTGVTIDTCAGGQPLTKCVMLLGIDPSQSVPRLWKSAREGKKAGGSLSYLAKSHGCTGSGSRMSMSS